MRRKYVCVCETVYEEELLERWITIPNMEVKALWWCSLERANSERRKKLKIDFLQHKFIIL